MLRIFSCCLNFPVKGVNFFGLGSEYVVSGSDCGHVFLWDREKMDIVQYFDGDQEGVVRLVYCLWYLKNMTTTTTTTCTCTYTV